MSAVGLRTVAVMEAVLLAGLGSASAEETVAVLVSEPVRFGRTTTVTLVTASLAKEPRLVKVRVS